MVRDAHVEGSETFARKLDTPGLVTGEQGLVGFRGFCEACGGQIGVGEVIRDAACAGSASRTWSSEGAGFYPVQAGFEFHVGPIWIQSDFRVQA